MVRVVIVRSLAVRATMTPQIAAPHHHHRRAAPRAAPPRASMSMPILRGCVRSLAREEATGVAVTAAGRVEVARAAATVVVGLVAVAMEAAMVAVAMVVVRRWW